MKKQLLAIAAGLTISTLAVGCTPPKVITHITSARDQIKFLVRQGNDQSVLKCQMGADGALSQCRSMTVALED